MIVDFFPKFFLDHYFNRAPCGLAPGGGMLPPFQDFQSYDAGTPTPHEPGLTFRNTRQLIWFLEH